MLTDLSSESQLVMPLASCQLSNAKWKVYTLETLIGNLQFSQNTQIAAS